MLRKVDEHMMKKTIAWSLGILLLLTLVACSRKAEKPTVERDSFSLDTEISIRLYDKKDKEELESILTETMKEIYRLETLLSVEKEGSDLDRSAKAAGKEWVDISPECQELLTASQEYWALSEGHFDITVGPLVDLWAIHDRKTGHYPTDEERTAAQQLISSEKLHIKNGRAYLEETGMKANLGAIAKGYIADKVKEFLEEAGIRHAVVNLGGNVILINGNSKGKDFAIGVRSPFDKTKEIARLYASGKSIVTAGVDQRFFEYNGEKYHHILDPFTGFPSDTGLLSVTVVSDHSVQGDALSTTCMLLGEEKGLALIENIPDVEALFVRENQELVRSSGFNKYEK